MKNQDNIFLIGAGVALLYYVFNDNGPEFEDTALPQNATVNTPKATTMASALYELLTNTQLYYFSNERCDLFGEYMIFSDADFIHAANIYKNTFKVTLRSSISALNLESCYRLETNHEQEVVDRMNRLNIP